MKFTEIDGLWYEVRCCDDCPFFNDGAGFEYLHTCQHPAWDRKEYMTISEFKTHEMHDKLCPLGDSKPGEDEVIDPTEAGVVFLDPPGSNEEKVIVTPEWAHTRLSEKEALGYMLAFSIPMLLEDISKRDPETKERIIKNLEEMLRMAQMKPEERPLCTMDQAVAMALWILKQNWEVPGWMSARIKVLPPRRNGE